MAPFSHQVRHTKERASSVAKQTRTARGMPGAEKLPTWRKKKMATSKRLVTIHRMEAELQKLQESHRLRGQQIEALEDEQRGNIVAARVRKSAGAQDNIERIAGEITKLRTEDTFDCVAIAEISANLEAERAALRRELWHKRCAAVRQLIEPRAAGDLEQKALALALDLKRTLELIADSNGKIVVALQSIHPSLLPCADRVGRMRARTPEMISANLDPWLENPFSKVYLDNIGRDPQALAVQNFTAVLQALDNLAEMEPGAESARSGVQQLSPAS